jgi:FYVE/RhoGEF/PH domain-containing protein 5/6
MDQAILARQAAASVAKLKPVPPKPTYNKPKLDPKPPSEPAPEIKKRINIVREIVATEASYVEQLNLVVDLYLNPLLSQKTDKGILSQEEIQALFSNIALIQDLNSKFLSALRDRVSIAQPDERNAAIGAVFLQFCPFFKMYTQYVNNHPEAVRVLHNTLYKREKAKQFLVVNEKISQAKGLDLEALLITPVQRIPRYKLLLEVLIKSTEENHIDYKDLTEALQLISKVAESINTAMRESQNRQEIVNIQKQFGKDINLVSPSRRFLLKGILAKKCRSADKEFTFFLFNDLLLYAHGGGLTAYFLHRMIEVNQAFKVNDLPDSSNGKNMFEILNSQRSFIVLASDPSVKQMWLKSLRDCVSEFEAHAKARSKAKGDQAESGTDYTAPVWVSDKSSSQCTICLNDFSLINRRHHCRKCGILICGNCSKGRLKIGSDMVRVCDRCIRSAESKSHTRSSSKNLEELLDEEKHAEEDLDDDDDDDDDYSSPPASSLGRMSNGDPMLCRVKHGHVGNRRRGELDLVEGEHLYVLYSNYDEQGNIWWYATRSLDTPQTGGWVSADMLQSSSSSSSVGVYRAVESFAGNADTEELGFKEGDLIDISEIHESGYYYGTNRRTDLSGWCDPVYLAQVQIL